MITWIQGSFISDALWTGCVWIGAGRDRSGLDGRGLDDGVQLGPHALVLLHVVVGLQLAVAGAAPYLRDGSPEAADGLQRVVRLLAPRPLANLHARWLPKFINVNYISFDITRLEDGPLMTTVISFVLNAGRTRYRRRQTKHYLIDATGQRLPME